MTTTELRKWNEVDRATYLHEAAHAVAAVSCGEDVAIVGIGDSDGSSFNPGQAGWTEFGRVHREIPAEALALMCLAGPAAHLVAEGHDSPRPEDPDQGEIWGSASADVLIANAVRHPWESHFPEAHAFVVRQWPQIERLADYYRRQPLGVTECTITDVVASGRDDEAN